ncbi:hypothetical protein B0H14DRAFT_2388759 [Mycena olivaceomarginata]|nr:hypothetical protein B0H14DRAFT_2388759 [Mycena olivaceomarginata]
MNYTFENLEPIWKPVNASWTTVEQLQRLINSKCGLDLKDYHDLHKYSVESYNFWLNLWEFLGVISSVPLKKVMS